MTIIFSGQPVSPHKCGLSTTCCLETTIVNLTPATPLKVLLTVPRLRTQPQGCDVIVHRGKSPVGEFIMCRRLERHKSQMAMRIQPWFFYLTVCKVSSAVLNSSGGVHVSAATKIMDDITDATGGSY